MGPHNLVEMARLQLLVLSWPTAIEPSDKRVMAFIARLAEYRHPCGVFVSVMSLTSLRWRSSNEAFALGHKGHFENERCRKGQYYCVTGHVIEGCCCALCAFAGLRKRSSLETKRSSFLHHIPILQLYDPPLFSRDYALIQYTVDT